VQLDGGLRALRERVRATDLASLYRDLHTGCFRRAQTAFHLGLFPSDQRHEDRAATAAREMASLNGADSQWRKLMTQIGLTKLAIAVSTFAGAALLSVGWSEQNGVSLSVENAQARVGRPLAPASVAGVARRQTRRAAYGYGAGAVGAGLAGATAVGTAAAVAATSPNWGWGGRPYYTGTGYYGGGPYYTSTGYYGGRPYYGGGVWGAKAAYYGSTGGVSSSDRDLYIRNLRESRYNPKDNFNANGTIVNQ